MLVLQLVERSRHLRRCNRPALQSIQSVPCRSRPSQSAVHDRAPSTGLRSPPHPSGSSPPPPGPAGSHASPSQRRTYRPTLGLNREHPSKPTESREAANIKSSRVVVAEGSKVFIPYEVTIAPPRALSASPQAQSTPPDLSHLPPSSTYPACPALSRRMSTSPDPVSLHTKPPPHTSLYCPVPVPSPTYPLQTVTPEPPSGCHSKP